MPSSTFAHGALRNAAPSLIGPQDPPPFTLFNEAGPTPALLVADHASNAIPAAMDHLGLGPGPLGQHIAYDIGIAWLTRRLSIRLEAPALLHGYSRLLVDPNRPLDDPTSICVISDHVIVPGNRDLSAEGRAQRAASFFHPYHAAVEAQIVGILRSGRVPALISLHSFTPEMRGRPRPWHVGILWDDVDGRIAVPLIDGLAADRSLCVGDNEPYTGRERHGYTVETHAMARGLANVLVEVRQDLITRREDAEAWADRLADCLSQILADPTVCQEHAG